MSSSDFSFDDDFSVDDITSSDLSDSGTEEEGDFYYEFLKKKEEREREEVLSEYEFVDSESEEEFSDVPPTKMVMRQTSRLYSSQFSSPQQPIATGIPIIPIQNIKYQSYLVSSEQISFPLRLQPPKLKIVSKQEGIRPKNALTIPEIGDNLPINIITKPMIMKATTPLVVPKTPEQLPITIIEVRPSKEKIIIPKIPDDFPIRNQDKPKLLSAILGYNEKISSPFTHPEQQIIIGQPLDKEPTLVTEDEIEKYMPALEKISRTDEIKQDSNETKLSFIIRKKYIELYKNRGGNTETAIKNSYIIAAKLNYGATYPYIIENNLYQIK